MSAVYVSCVYVSTVYISNVYVCTVYVSCVYISNVYACTVYVSSVATKLTLKEVWLRNSTTVSFIILNKMENMTNKYQKGKIKKHENRKTRKSLF